MDGGDDSMSNQLAVTLSRVLTESQWRAGETDMGLDQRRPYVHASSSNYKEMLTLLNALELLESNPERKAACFGTTLFYFTDNLVTYFAVQGGSSESPGLQSLVCQIKLLELRLGCLLEVVQGVGMIDQGTDAESSEPSIQRPKTPTITRRV
jgi:hypothetical protein